MALNREQLGGPEATYLNKKENVYFSWSYSEKTWMQNSTGQLPGAVIIFKIYYERYASCKTEEQYGTISGLHITQLNIWRQTI